MKEQTKDDEEYLLERYRHCKSVGDIREAKTWLITAQLMHPSNFDVQFEFMLNECENVDIYSKRLQNLLKNFPQHPKLWKYLSQLIASLEHSKLFLSLPTETQQYIMQTCALKDVSQSTFEHCKQFQQLFRQFPSTLSSEGPALIRRMLAEDDAFTTDKTEALSKIFLLEICSECLRVASVGALDEIVLHKIYNASIFYVINCWQKSLKVPWKEIFELLKLIGHHLGWILTQEIARACYTDSNWQLVYAFVQKLQLKSQSLNELFCVASMCLLRHLIEFSYNTLENGNTNCDVPRVNVVLVEAFVMPSITLHSSTKIDSNNSPCHRQRSVSTEDEDLLRRPFVTASSNSVKVAHFIYAVTYYDLLLSDPKLKTKLEKLNIHSLMADFHLDYLLYQGRHHEAFPWLRQSQMVVTSSSLEDCSVKIGFLARMSTIHFCLGDFSAAFKHIMQLVALIFSTKSKKSSNDIIGNGSLFKQATLRPRHLHFLSLTTSSLLAYSVQLMSQMLQTVSASGNDLILGHLIVLLQHNWPEERELLSILMNRIRLNKCFTYPAFTRYIVNADIIEEFAFLLNGSVSLDISPISEQTVTFRRMGTRGANKGEKEEVKTILRKQIQRHREDIDDIILHFFMENRDNLFQCLR